MSNELITIKYSSTIKKMNSIVIDIKTGYNL